MPPIKKRSVSNRLLARLAAEDFETLEHHLEPLDLPNRYMLGECGQSAKYAYFLNSGIGSIIAGSPEGQRAEAGLFGREGWTPTTLIMGGDSSPCDILMQVVGEGYRIERAALLEALQKCPALRKLLMLFDQTLNTQTSFTALSNAAHHVNERLARWLLMCDDRVDGGEIALTHEFLSLMLAVRRPSVTTALHVLEGNRFITAERGVISVRDRAGMAAFAADSYGQPEAEYQRLIGTMR